MYEYKFLLLVSSIIHKNIYIYMLKFIKKLKILLDNLPIRYFIFTTNLRELKLILLTNIIKAIFTRLLSLVFKNEKKVIDNINLIIFFFDKFIVNVRVFYNILIGMVQPGEVWVRHYSEELYNGMHFFDDGVDFNYERHFNCSPVDHSDVHFAVSSGPLHNVPYAGVINRQTSLLYYNISQLLSNPGIYRAFQGNGSLNPSIFENLPIHTSYTLYNDLNPISFDFFLGQREPYLNDVDGNPIMPGYIIKDGTFMYRYIPDHMLYFSYPGGGGYNPNGWGLLSQCPFEAAKHPLHQGTYGFTLSPIYRVYNAEAFDPTIDSTDGSIWFCPLGTCSAAFPRVISNSPELANYEVISNFNSSAHNNVYVIKCGNELKFVVISDQDLNGKVTYCLGHSHHFLNGKRLVYDENGFHDVTVRHLLVRGRDVNKINICRHYDIKGSVLVTEYRGNS